jgi:hypothetical protein
MQLIKGRKIKIKRLLISLAKIAGVVMVAVYIASCMFIDSVDVPASAPANTPTDFVMHVRIRPNASNTSKFVIGFMAPKGWSAGQNTTVTFTSTNGNGSMDRMPAGTICPNSNGADWPTALKTKYGIGPNLIDDVEWVVFQSVNSYSVNEQSSIDVLVKIKSKTGSENMLVKLGFFAGNSNDGFAIGINGVPTYSSFFSSCFEVTGGAGDLVDFCNPQLAFIEPAKSLDNDIITIIFDNGVVTTPLETLNDIYLCATAVTTDGDNIPVCEQTPKTKLKAANGGRFRTDFWPRGFFNVPAGKTLSRIEYFVTNADGSIKIGYGGSTTDPFIYTFRCN